MFYVHYYYYHYYIFKQGWTQWQTIALYVLYLNDFELLIWSINPFTHYNPLIVTQIWITLTKFSKGNPSSTVPYPWVNKERIWKKIIIYQNQALLRKHFIFMVSETMHITESVNKNYQRNSQLWNNLRSTQQSVLWALPK